MTANASFNAVQAPLVPDERLLRAGSRKITIRLLPLLLIGYLVSYIDRTNVGFAALTMNQAIGLTATQFGIAAGAFYVGYVLLEVPSNLVLQRVGARRWLARIMVTWGIAVAGTAFARGPHSLYAWRLVTGAAEAGFYPGVIFYLTTWVPRKHRAKAFGWFNVANPLASVISGPLSAALLRMDGVWGIAGWRWLFILEGIPACALGIYTFCVLPDRPGNVAWLTDTEKAAIQNALQREKRAATTTQLLRALRDPRIVMLTLSYFFLITGILGVTLWLPQMLKQHGLTTTAIGLNSAWPYLFACLGLLVWSAYLDRTGQYLVNYVFACFIAAIGFGISVLYSSLPLTLIGITIALIGMNACRPAFYSILPTFLSGTAIAGTIAFINATGNVGGFVGPYLVGWLRETTGSFKPGMFALAAMLAAAGVSASLVNLVRRPAEVPADL